MTFFSCFILTIVFLVLMALDTIWGFRNDKVELKKQLFFLFCLWIIGIVIIFIDFKLHP